MRTVPVYLVIAAVLAVAGCASASKTMYLHSDANSAVKTLAIIRPATQDEMQGKLTHNIFKENYYAVLSGIRDGSDSTGTYPVSTNATDSVAYVAPGRYVMQVKCVSYSGGMWLTFDQPIAVEAGKLYLLECSHDVPYKTRVIIVARPQSGR